MSKNTGLSSKKPKVSKSLERDNSNEIKCKSYDKAYIDLSDEKKLSHSIKNQKNKTILENELEEDNSLVEIIDGPLDEYKASQLVTDFYTNSIGEVSETVSIKSNKNNLINNIPKSFVKQSTQKNLPVKGISLNEISIDEIKSNLLKYSQNGDKEEFLKNMDLYILFNKHTDF